MPGAEPAVTGTPAHWRAVRRLLNQRRHELTGIASGLYPGVHRVATSPLLCRPEWIPPAPAELNRVLLRWVDNAPAPAVTGTEAAAGHVRPFRSANERYPAYSGALSELDPPAVFENRPAYRMLSADLASGQPQMSLSRCWYFDGVNVSEAVAHELAEAWRFDPAALAAHRLPFRQAVGDPCDLPRRSGVHAITTLTLRRTRSGEASFLLHWRDPAKVTHAGGLYQVMPVGIFQPAGDTPADERNDFSLWRSMVREFSEEVLGAEENYRHLGSPLDYGRWDFYRQLSAARAAGKLRVFCLGMGVDPLTFAIDVLTVAVFDSDVFDAAFTGRVAVNAEGRVISEPGTHGFPFTRDAVTRFAGGSEPMQAAGVAVLDLAWEHRAQLLS
jgi:hypothetical protein